MTVGSNPHLHTNDRVRRNFFETSRQWDNLYHNKRRIRILCRQHVLLSAVTIDYYST